ncbi:hypothetical protein M9Y10_017010 [Tritrichomonas musculus]|uniref:Uncharacterized protein n=1 Tax=Tritrichomonas musculus TaxID=1915356 RepID=A0ABR2HXT1_9EUKA
MIHPSCLRENICIFITQVSQEQSDAHDIINNNSITTLNLTETMSNFNILKYLPKNITISTNNESRKFNLEIFERSSQVIYEFIRSKPDCKQYHININDKYNVLSKISQIFDGDKIIFKPSEIPTLKKIISSLSINCCSNFLENILDGDSNITLALNNHNIKHYVKQEKFITFKISTKNNVYQCNSFGVLFSVVICEYLQKNPNAKKFEYNFDDKFNEFQEICDLFNFNSVKVNTDNMKSLKKISEDLKIAVIKEKIDQNCQNYEKFTQMIDEQQQVVDLIEELFNWLYNIEILTVKTVTDLIIHSIWANTEENVKELAAFILHVIRTEIPLHPFLVDLLIQLEQSSNKKKKLMILMPFIIDKLKNILDEDLANCSFVYNLYKKEIISREILNEILMNAYHNESTI